MKSLLLSSILLILALTSFSQEKTTIKEVGFTFYSLNGFGLTYRIGNDNAVWRFNSAFGTITEGNDFSGGETKSFGFGINAGREWRKPITDKLSFRYGVDIFYNYQERKSEFIIPNLSERNKNEELSRSLGSNLVLGVNYKVSSAIFVGVEVLPFFSYITSDYTNRGYYTDSNGQIIENNNESEQTTGGFGFQNNSALISVVYRY